MTELTRESTIEIDVNDLAAILTETFCRDYGPFKNTYVDSVLPLDDGTTFKLMLSIKETEAA
jgi:hypothetical protein